MKDDLLNNLQTGAKTTMTRTVNQITLLYDYDAIMSRREGCKGGEVNQIEHQYVITSAPLAIPVKARKHLAGFNSGNGVGPLSLPSWKSPMTMQHTFKAKKQLFGTTRLPVGGSLRHGTVAAGDDEAKSKPKPRLDSDVEPTLYHNMSQDFYDAEIHGGNYSSILDFTLGQGSLAFACIKANVPHMAFCVQRGPRQRALQTFGVLDIAGNADRRHTWPL